MKKYFYLLILISLSGCSSLGPKQINTDRSAYNDIVSQTNNEQLLANIVRQAYAESAAYLQITSVTASYSLNKSLSLTPGWSATSSIGTDTSTTLSASAGPSISYSESPTISYMPLDDATAVRMMQKPLGFDDISLLLHQGYDNLNYLGRLLFLNIGPLYATNPKSMFPPKDTDFYRFIQILGDMQQKQTVDIVASIYQDQPALIIGFNKSSTSAPAMTLKKLAQVPLDSDSIVLIASAARADNLKLDATTQHLKSNASNLPKNVVSVKMKSINGILAFLSRSVQIPEADRNAHLTPILLDKNGQPYNWAPLMKGLMTIYSSDTEPTDAFVKTRVNGHGFYIKKSDIDSKVTFNVVFTLMSISNGVGGTPPAQLAPVLIKAI